MQKLKVILVFALYQFLDLNVSHYAQLSKTLLQQFKVAYKLVVVFSLPVDFGKLNFSRVEEVNELAVYGSCAELLDLGQVGFEEFIDPGEKLASG